MSDRATPSKSEKSAPEGTSTRQKTARSAAGTSRRRVSGRHERSVTVSGRLTTMSAAAARATRCSSKGSRRGAFEYSAISPPIPGPEPSPRRIEIEPSTATAPRRPRGAALTRKAVQVPKKAPVARPWMPRATSSPPSGGSVMRIAWASARVAIAASSTRLRPTRSESWPRLSIEGTSAST